MLKKVSNYNETMLEVECFTVIVGVNTNERKIPTLLIFMYGRVTWKMSPAASNRYEIIVTNPIYYRPNDFNFFFVCLVTSMQHARIR